jgi:hypothetical protein
VTADELIEIYKKISIFSCTLMKPMICRVLPILNKKNGDDAIVNDLFNCKVFDLKK